MKLIIYSLQKPMRTFRLLIVFATILCSNSLFADGSKDLYPSGALGLRAYLRSNLVATENWPFPNEGTHYVYARVGERITLASSAQSNGGTSRIRLYAPDGTLKVNDNSSAGQIPNRIAEIAGPQLTGAASGGKYIPIYYTIPAGGAGIYRVEFVSRGGGDPSYTVSANSSWTQGSDVSIMAWDVSVINVGNSAFIPGRVYTNVLNLSNGLTNVNTDGFYGKLYALTKDGYTYRVNNNGNNGIYFTFFVNNNGFIDATTQNPVYKSLNGSSPSFLAGKVHNPNSADTVKNITHKMFYTLPSADLPTSSGGAVPGVNTWLKNKVVTPLVTNVNVVGVEGTIGQISKKGGYIKFNADVQGNYSIGIEATSANPGFVTRILTGSSSAGSNQIFWDGKDGVGTASPVGTFPVKITIRLQQAEVHFPYIDMEYNRSGTVVELLDYTKLNLSTPIVQVVSDIVYWNDTDIPNVSNGTNSLPKNNSHLPTTNSVGISSNSNGHKWGVGGTTTQRLFGDEKSIDTWTFVKAEEATVITSVNVKSADLMVSSLTSDRTSALMGEQVAYTIKVKNGGISDVTGAPFLFKIPIGLSPQNIQFTNNGCGSESLALTYNSGNNTYSSNLNLPNGCEITYVVTLNVNNLAIAGNQVAEAAILRINDISDPDATNTNITIPPTDPYYECANNGLDGSCNNIKSHNAMVLTLACYEDSNIANSGIPSKHGITLLQRAGGTTTDWPMVRTSAYTVLESNTKGFVITRMTSDPIIPVPVNHLSKITDPQNGMMVYDTFAKCLKLYDGAAWSCFNTVACP